jgi:hypothetical protein
MSVPADSRPYCPRIDFGWIGQAWRLFTQQPGLWIGAIALYVVISVAIAALIAVPTGFYGYLINLYRSMMSASSGAGPMTPVSPRAQALHMLPFSLIMAVVNGLLYGGLYRTALRQTRGETISVAGIFSALDVAGPLIAVALVLAAIVEAAQLVIPPFAFLVSILIEGIFMFAPLIIVDRRVGPITALADSLDLLRGQRWIGIFYFLIVLILALIGSLACGVGIIVTMPMLYLALAVAYRAMTEPPRPDLPTYGQAAPGVWPPPPNV